MSMYARRYMLSRGEPFVTVPDRPRRKTRFDVSLVELIRPECYWPHPYALEQAFETFRWMVAKGEDYRSSQQWGPVGVRELLSDTSGCNLSAVSPITSVVDLRKRFHCALLGYPRAESIARWREDHGISPVSKIRVTAPVYTPFVGARHLGWNSERAIHADFARLTEGCCGHRMAIPLNYIHLDCRYLHKVSVHVRPDTFRFVLTFGQDPTNDPYASCWDKTISVTRPGESFLDTFARARDVFDVIVLGMSKSCDGADLLQSCEYNMRWHRKYLARFLAGNREEPDMRGLREAEYAENVAASNAQKVAAPAPSAPTDAGGQA